MRVMISISVCLLIIFTGALISGCGRLEEYGERISNQEITKISDILKKPKSYDQKTLIIEGKIMVECPAGCWFTLRDDSGVIYVDLGPSGFAIAQHTGDEVLVVGEIVDKKPNPIMIGKGVKIK